MPINRNNFYLLKIFMGINHFKEQLIFVNTIFNYNNAALKQAERLVMCAYTMSLFQIVKQNHQCLLLQS
jgi:hypothetical protein